MQEHGPFAAALAKAYPDVVVESVRPKKGNRYDLLLSLLLLGNNADIVQGDVSFLRFVIFLIVLQLREENKDLLSQTSAFKLFGNDAQKVMGIIGAAVIFYQHQLGHTLTFKQFVNQNMWVPIASFTCIALGTLSG